MEQLVANRTPEPTPSPSQEGSSASWIIPLLGEVRGGLATSLWKRNRAVVSPSRVVRFVFINVYKIHFNGRSLMFLNQQGLP